MKNERVYKNIGSAWGWLRKVAFILVLFFAIPLIALNNSALDALDNWSADVNNQLKVVACICAFGLVMAARHFIKRYKQAE